MSKVPTTLLSHLPEVYQTSGGYLHQLLLAFEALLLTGSNSLSDNQTDSWLGLEQKIAEIPNLFNPKPGSDPSDDFFAKTPKSFLPWFADWVALSQLHLLSEEQGRIVISKIAPLYSSRGTKHYLSEIIKLFFPEPDMHAIIHDEELPTLTVGVSKVGEDTRLGGDIPFYFYVTIRFSERKENISDLELLKEKLRSVIDLAKPAHTDYHLEFEYGRSTRAKDHPVQNNEYLI